MNASPTKEELLNAIRESRAELESVLAEVPAEILTRPGVNGEWSVKDTLAHIATWERLASDRIRAAQSGGEPSYPPMKGETAVNAFNAEVFEKFRNAPLEEVQREFQEAHRELLDLIEQLDENLLPSRLPFDWAENLTYQVLISANTHWHYPEHTEAIAAWLEREMKR